MNIFPREAVTENTGWRVSGPVSLVNWKPGGDDFETSTLGNYGVNFKDIGGWVTPEDILINVTGGSHLVVGGNYTPVPTAWCGYGYGASYAEPDSISFPSAWSFLTQPRPLPVHEIESGSTNQVMISSTRHRQWSLLSPLRRRANSLRLAQSRISSLTMRHSHWRPQ